MEQHKLLKRQLKRYVDQDDFTEQNPRLFQAISDAYEQNQQELELLERSLFITSNELNERNQVLRNKLEQLQDTQLELTQSLGTLQATLEATGEIILIYDDKNQLVSYNTMGQTFYEKELKQRPENPEVLKQGLARPSQMDEVTKALKNDPEQWLTGSMEFKSGTVYDYRSLPKRRDGQFSGRVWCLRDVTEQKRAEVTIQHQAFHDALTKLPNRLLLLDRIEHGLTLAKRNGNILAVLFIDLDNFKRVNDTEGHSAGDELLIKVSQRIQSRLREQDTLARIGGDEFVVLLEGCANQHPATKLCRDLLSILAQPFDIGTRQHFIGCSIGVSLFPQDDGAADSLIRKADMAMYKAKALGKNNFQYYSEELERDAISQMEVESRLRKAIDRKELNVYYQPKMDLKTLQIVGAEALVRWFHEDGSATP